MTRINANFPPIELVNKHLLAEHRELPRVCNRLKVRIEKNKFDDIPAPYFDKRPNGEVAFKELFWIDKGKFTLDRYNSIHEECKRRGFNVTDFSSSWDIYKKKPEYFNDYVPSNFENNMIRIRIKQRLKQMNS